MLKPGGGPPPSPPCVDVSVENPLRGRRMASACVWKGKFMFSRRERRVRVDVVKEPGNLLRPGLSCQSWIERRKLCHLIPTNTACLAAELLTSLAVELMMSKI
jgi:hypothetical protein